MVNHPPPFLQLLLQRLSLSPTPSLSASYRKFLSTPAWSAAASSLLLTCLSLSLTSPPFPLPDDPSAYAFGPLPSAPGRSPARALCDLSASHVLQILGALSVLASSPPQELSAALDPNICRELV
ncbi:hypothetical protein TeGR_g10402, partial [Tetraparma gracilis]